MRDILEQLAKEHNGALTYQWMIDAGITKRQIRGFLADKSLEKVARGIYYHKDYLEDNMLIYQMENSNVIFSHESAAFLHGLTDRFPRKFSITTHQNKHLNSAENMSIFYVKKDILNMGRIETADDAGNRLITYDRERTVCDLIRSKARIELQVYNETIQNYFKSKTNLNLLSMYATQLGIKEEVKDIVYLMISCSR